MPDANFATNTTDVRLEQATERDATLLSNLLELYIHDMSVAFPQVALGPDGRFGYPPLERYWKEPATRFAYLIKAHANVVGFALVTRSSSTHELQNMSDVAEFFVLRQHRRSGIGRQAAFLLWDAFPGSWTVRVVDANPGAAAFWSALATEYTHGDVSATIRQDNDRSWRVFTFASRSPQQ